MSGEPTAPLHRVFTARSEIAPAIDELIGLARRTLRVFDADLSECGFDRADRIALLRSFLRASRNCRIAIVVHDPRYLLDRCPRFVALWRQFSEPIEVKRTLPEARVANDAFAIADDTAYWHRYHRDHANAELSGSDPSKLSALAHRFDELWELSETAGGPGVLGL